MAQRFVGKRTLVIDVYPLKSQKQFVNTLDDNIRYKGAMTNLSVTMPKLRFLTKLRTSLEFTIAPVGTQCLTTKTRIQLREDTAPSKVRPTPSRIELVLQLIVGFYA